MKIKTISILLILVMGLISCNSIPSGENEVLKNVENLIKGAMDQAKVTGLAVSIVKDGEILLSEGYGDSDRGEIIRPVTKDTLFQIGSITKIITAMAVMNLVEEGLLNLDSDVRDYLTGFDPKGDFVKNTGITIRDLLTHQSGLPSSYLKDFMLDKPESDLFMNTSDLLSDEYLVWESGKVWAYNNTAFSLLGELIATVSGLSYVRYIEENIFKPLGLEEAQVYLTDSDDPLVSKGFTMGESAELMYIKDLPAGSVLFSAEHMSVFMKELIDCNRGKSEKILTTKTLKSMFVRQNINVQLDDTFEIGLTFWLSSFKGKQTVGHGGTISPFYSEMKLVPEEGIGIFLNSNDNAGDNSFLHLLEGEILNLLIPGEMESQETAVQELEVKDLEGYYTGGVFGMFNLTMENDQLFANIPEMGVHSPIIINKDGTMLIRDMGLSLISTDTEGAEFFCYMQDIFLGPITKILTEPINSLWSEREGRYVSDNIVQAITLSYNNNAQTHILNVEVMGGHMPLALTVKSDSHLQVQGYGRNQGNILEYFEQDSGKYIKYAGITLIRENE